MIFRDTFARRVLLCSLAAALIPLVISQVATYLSLKATVQREIQLKLNLVAEQKYRQVESFLGEREADIKSVSRAPVIVQTMHDLVVFSRDLAYPTRYGAIVQNCLGYLTVFTNLYPYADAMLITTNGDVQVSLARGPELGNNLRTGPFGDTQLARAFQHCLRTRQVILSDLRWHRVTGRPAQFLVAPITKNGALLGFAALELRGQKIFELTQDLSGLGGSGEVVLLSLEGERVLLLSPLRTGRYLPLQHAWPLDRFSRVPLHLAALGKKGSGVRKDHRGVTTIAWWSYLPRTRWGMVVKMDADEAFATVYRERSRSEAIALVGLILAAAGCLWGAWSVSRPLRALQEGVRRRAAGESTQPVGTAAQDEVGQLGRLFDGLMNRLQQVTAARDGLTQDVAVHQSAETEYRRLALVATKTSQAVLMTDRDRRIEWVNEAFARLTGYELAEIAGKDPIEVLQSPATAPAAIETLRRATQELSAARVELCLCQKSGELYWLELHWQPLFDSAAQVEKWMALGTDITHRKAAELQAQQAAALKERQQQEACAEWEAQRQQDQTESAARANELARCQGESAAHTSELAQAKGELERLQAILAQERETAARGQQDTEQLRKELAAARDESEQRRTQVEARAIELTRRAADLDQLNQSWAEERKSRQTAQQEGERLREQLAAAHSATPTPRDLEKAVVANVREALHTLLPEMLATEPVAAMDFELEDVLAEVAAQVGAKATQKGLEFLFDVAPDLPPVLHGDPRQLGHVLTQLTTNAVATTRQGEVVVRVETVEEDENAVLLRFAVRDTGIGLTPEQRDRIFELQIEAGESSSATAGHVGLGLVLSKYSVERMGGDLGVVSQVDKGSTFWFTARLGRSRQAPRKQPGRLPGEPCKLRALVADDNESALVVASEMLQNLGLESVTVGSGRQVLDLLAASASAQTPFDLVLLDQDVPEMDGLEVARRIRQHAEISSQPVVILATVRGHEHILAQPGAPRLDGVLAKPITAWRLYEVISKVLPQTPTVPAPGAPEDLQPDSPPPPPLAPAPGPHARPDPEAEPPVTAAPSSESVDQAVAPAETKVVVSVQEVAAETPPVERMTDDAAAAPKAETGICVTSDEDRPPWEEAPPVQKTVLPLETPPETMAETTATELPPVMAPLKTRPAAEREGEAITPAPMAEPASGTTGNLELNVEPTAVEPPGAAGVPEPMANLLPPRAVELAPAPPSPPATPEPPLLAEDAKPAPAVEAARKPRRAKQPKFETLDLFGEVSSKPAITVIEDPEILPRQGDLLAAESEPMPPRAKKPKREDKPVATEPPKAVLADDLPARIAGVNLAEGLRQAGGDRGEYLGRLREFGRHEPGALGLIREAVDEPDLKAAEKLAHALKERSSHLGIHEVAQASAALETALRSQEPLLVTSAFDELEHKLAALAGALKAVESPAPVPIKHSPVPPTGPWDKPVFLRKLQMLRELVESGDAEARHLLAQIRAVSGGKHAEELAAIEKHIQTEDFGRAADIAVDLEMALQK